MERDDRHIKNINGLDILRHAALTIPQGTSCSNQKRNLLASVRFLLNSVIRSSLSKVAQITSPRLLHRSILCEMSKTGYFCHQLPNIKLNMQYEPCSYEIKAPTCVLLTFFSNSLNLWHRILAAPHQRIIIMASLSNNSNEMCINHLQCL